MVPRKKVSKDSLSQPNIAQEGSCDENPIILNGIVRREFDYLHPFLSGRYTLMAWFA